MAGISGLGTTFNLPNYHGQLFSVSPTDTPFLSAIGGLSGGESTSSKDFTWQSYDLRSGDATRTRLEGADAPTAEERVRAEISNVCQIFQEQVAVSYSKQAAVGNFDGLNVEGANPVQDEMSWQLTQSLKQMALDVEVALLTGSYAKPADNSTARTTRGLIPAITTNVVNGSTVNAAEGISATATTAGVWTATAHGLSVNDAVALTAKTGGTAGIAIDTTYYVKAVTDANTFTLAVTKGGTQVTPSTAVTASTIVPNAPVTQDLVSDLLQQAWENGGIRESDTATLICNGSVKRELSKAYIVDGGYSEATRNVGGVSVDTILTDFGRLNVMLDRWMPADTLVVASLEVCKPRVLFIPGKGFLFAEPLAKTGAADKVQLYGEIGLEYGLESQHAKAVRVGA